MEHRLIFVVLFVTLSWKPACIYAQSSTMAPTTASAITMAPTTASATTMAATTASGNTGSATTMAATTASGNTGSATTMAAATTPTMAPEITANTNVTILTVPIDNSGCGSQRLCAAEPADCNPADSESCFFIGAQQESGQNFNFSVAGESDGYIGCTLSEDTTLGGNDTTYVCANNNGSVQFFSTFLDNDVLTVTELPVDSVQGVVNGNAIQCTFRATVPTSTLRTTTFVLGGISGSFNATSGTLGAPNTVLRTNAVNLANPNATVTNEVNSTTTTTTAPTTTMSGGISIQRSFMQALLVTVGMIFLAML